MTPGRQHAGTTQRVRTVLVTGGAGYIGSTLVRGLLADGLRVRVLDALLRGDGGIRALYTNPDFELIRGDVRRPEAVVRAASGVDAVIHLAAVEGELLCRRNAASALETNVEATGLIVEVCRGLAVSRFAFASTLEIYGPMQRAIDESSAPDPPSLYAASKLDAEALALAGAESPPAAAIFRLGEVFGVGAIGDSEGAINPMTARAWEAKRIAAPSETRRVCRTHVNDVCGVLRQAMACRAEVIAGQIFNVGAERLCLSAGQVAAMLADMTSCPASEDREGEETAGPRIDFRKLRSRLGVACVTPLRQGLTELLLHWRRGGTILEARRAPETLRERRPGQAAAKFVA